MGRRIVSEWKVRGTARQFIANVRLSLTGNHEQLDELALLYGR